MTTDRFVYEKVINGIIEMIRAEGYAPGSKLPGVRELAEKFGCNLHTVRKAIAFLSEDGVIEQRMRLGNFVRCDTRYLVGKPQARVQIVSMRRIGVLLFPAVSEFSTALLLELEQQAVERELQLEHQIANDWTSAAEGMHAMKRNNTRAVILLADQENFNSPDAHACLDHAPLPIVLGRSISGYESWCYEPRELFSWFDRDTIFFQFRYFQALGFENIAYFGRRSPDGRNPHYRYYRECVTAAGMSDRAVFAGVAACEADAALDQWAEARGRLAVICYDDISAMRLVIAARKRGWNLPGEMAVMGVNNFDFARYVDPPLSSVLFPYRYLAGRLLDRAWDFAEGRREFRETPLPRLEVLVRESCCGRLRREPVALRQLLVSLGAVPEDGANQEVALIQETV